MIDIDVLFALGILIAFVFGIRSTIRLWLRYRAAGDVLDGRDRLILRSFVAVSVAITLAAGFYGLLVFQHLAGLNVMDWQPALAELVAIGVLFIPTALDLAVQRIARP